MFADRLQDHIMKDLSGIYLDQNYDITYQLNRDLSTRDSYTITTPGRPTAYAHMTQADIHLRIHSTKWRAACWKLITPRVAMVPEGL